MESRTTTTAADVAAEIMTEGGLSMGQAATKFPVFRGSAPVNPSTIWRWITVGVRLQSGERLRLEAIRLGGRWLTSEAAIKRFLRNQTPTFTTEAEPAAKPRGRRAQAALDELAKAGI